MTGSEFRATVATDRTFNDIFAVEIVGEVTEVRIHNGSAAAFRQVTDSNIYTLAEKHLASVGITGCVCTETVALADDRFLTYEDTEIILVGDSETIFSRVGIGERIVA